MHAAWQPKVDDEKLLWDIDTDAGLPVAVRFAALIILRFVFTRNCPSTLSLATRSGSLLGPDAAPAAAVSCLQPSAHVAIAGKRRPYDIAMDCSCVSQHVTDAHLDVDFELSLSAIAIVIAGASREAADHMAP